MKSQSRRRCTLRSTTTAANLLMQGAPSLLLLLAVVLLAGCRGTESEGEPIHLNLNMDFQPKLVPYGASTFFEDGKAMRDPVQGTVARGMLREDPGFYRGRSEDGGYVTEIPVPVTMDLLERGRERYNIYCSVCHGDAGDGLGIIMTGQYGYTPVPSFHDERLQQESVGYFYDVIENGVRTMPPYGHQVAVADRWAIVAFLRALQRTQDASLEDIPEDQRSGLPIAEMPEEDEQAETDTLDAPADDEAAEEQPEADATQ